MSIFLVIVAFVLGFLVPRDAFPWMKRLSRWLMFNRDNKLIARVVVAVALAVLILAVAFGCSKREPATFTPSPRSTDALAVIKQDAQVWANYDLRRRYWAEVAATGSMKPFIDEHSIVLCRRYVSGQELPNGSVVIYRYSDALPRVLHVVSDQNDTHVYMSGYANRASDGWQPKTAIEGVVVGQLYTP